MDPVCVSGAGRGGGGGGEQVEGGGRGVKVFWGVGGGYGGVRTAGCGWVCQGHVSILALLASGLEGSGTQSLTETVQLLWTKSGVSFPLCCIRPHTSC